MAITQGAKKAHRASLKKRTYNLRRKKAMSEVIKRVRKLVTEGKADEARTLLPAAHKAIDKAAKRGVIKGNNAARKKSRLASAIVRAGK